MSTTQLSEDQIRRLVAELMNRKPDMVYLLNQSGIAVSKDTPLPDVQRKYLTAIKDNARFRQNTASYMADMVKGQKMSFADNNEYLNDIGSALGINQINPNAAASTYNQVAAPASSSTSSTGSSGGGFGSWLGSIFTPQVIGSAINTGLNAYSNNLNAKAQQATAQDTIAAEQLKLQQLQAEQALAAQQAAVNHGMPTWAWLAIGLSAMGIVAMVLYFRRKKIAKA